MKSLITTLLHSVTDLKSYQDIAVKSFWSSLGYFVFFFFIISLILGVTISRTILPSVTTDLQTSLETLNTTYPDSLTVSLENNQLSASGAAEPINFPLPTLHQFAQVGNLASIDTATDPASIAAKDTLLLFTKNALSFKSNADSEYRIIPYQDLNLSGTLTKSSFQEYVAQSLEDIETLRPYAPYALTFIIFLGLTVGRFVFVAINAVFITLTGMLFNRRIGYKTSLVISLHTMVLVQILDLVIQLLYHQAYPTVFNLAFFAITMLAIAQLPENPKKTLA